MNCRLRRDGKTTFWMGRTVGGKEKEHSDGNIQTCYLTPNPTTHAYQKFWRTSVLVPWFLRQKLRFLAFQKSPEFRMVLYTACFYNRRLERLNRVTRLNGLGLAQWESIWETKWLTSNLISTVDQFPWSQILSSYVISLND